MPKNIIDKIWENHVVYSEDGAPDVFFIDLQLVHEVTSPQAFQMLRDEAMEVFSPGRNVATPCGVELHGGSGGRVPQHHRLL